MDYTTPKIFPTNSYYVYFTYMNLIFCLCKTSPEKGDPSIMTKRFLLLADLEKPNLVTDDSFIKMGVHLSNFVTSQKTFFTVKTKAKTLSSLK